MRCCHSLSDIMGFPYPPRRFPNRSFVRPVVEKVAARLQPCMGQLMSKSGRLIIVKSGASAMPIYILMAYLPSWAISEIDALRRRFLWAGGEESVRVKCMVAWPTVCLPTINGGLGVLDLRLPALRCRSAGFGYNALTRRESGPPLTSRLIQWFLLSFRLPHQQKLEMAITLSFGQIAGLTGVPSRI